MNREPTDLPARNAGEAAKRRTARRRLIRLPPLAAAAFLFWTVLRDTPLSEIGQALSLIRPWQICVILVINILFHALTGLRWWILARRDIPSARILSMIVIRLGAYGLSYFTPGPQLGGEPLQIQFLRRQHAASFARATATVIVDRLVELLTGFIFLVGGLSSLLHEGLIPSLASVSPGFLVLLVIVITWPAAHMILLSRGAYPVSRALDLLPAPRALRRPWRLIRAAEHLAGRFCQRRPRAVLAGLAASLLAASLAVMEYALVTSFLGMGLSPSQIVAGWTAGWLSFLVPVPGALGALEGSQVLALGSFGIVRGAALGAALLLRARDLLFGGAGLLISARHISRALGPFRTADAI